MKREVNGVVWVVVALLVTLVPLLMGYARFLWELEYYRWFPVATVVAVVSFVVSYLRSDVREERVRVKPDVVHATVFVALGVTAIGYLYEESRLAVLVMLMALLLLVLDCAGRRRMTKPFAIFLLLFTLVSIPSQFEILIRGYFEAWAGKLAGYGIDLLGQHNLVQGSVLIMGDYEINVREIIGGWNSYNLWVVIALFWSVWKWRSNLFTVLFCLVAVPVGLSLDVFKIVWIGAVYYFFGKDWSGQGEMLILELVSIVLGLGVMASCYAFVDLLLSTIDDAKKSKKVLVKAWDTVVSFKLSQCFRRWRILYNDADAVRRPHRVRKAVLGAMWVGLVCFASVIVYYRYVVVAERVVKMHSEEDLVRVPSDKVVFDRPGWEVVSVDYEEREFDSIWGAFSTVWRTKYHDTQVIFALDYPFESWHDVRVCYSNLGWQVEEAHLVQPDPSVAWGSSETDMILPTGDYGFIQCSHTNQLGEMVQAKPSESFSLEFLLFKLGPTRWAAPFGQSLEKDKNTFYQTQMMVTTAFPLDEPTKQELRAMYAEFREQTRQLIKEEGMK
ncbi:exosortase U [Rubritalea spongiae]|uniref:Exosortase U n=1 Tax=Rubritalea spongiae TaxID=430797 RepID=A0ABW5E0Z2_9BACT